jgi:hypothetical protein
LKLGGFQKRRFHPPSTILYPQEPRSSFPCLGEAAGALFASCTNRCSLYVMLKVSSMKRTGPIKKRLKPVVHLKRKQKSQPVNPNHWSEKSKRSVTFQVPPSHYEDVHYKCGRCRRDAVFTAVDQKLAFEGRKAHIWQSRTLCSECWSERRRIEHDIRGCQVRWRTDERQLQHDGEFLRRWLRLLESHPDYGRRKNHAGIAMLRRLAGKSA